MNKLVLRQFAIGFVLLILLLPAVVFAQDPFGINYGANSGLGTGDVRNVVIQLVNVVLGILGVVMLVIIIVAGFRWMSSGGNEETITSSRKSIAAAVIGLLIVFIAYGITVFVFSVLEEAT